MCLLASKLCEPHSALCGGRGHSTQSVFFDHSPPFLRQNLSLKCHLECCLGETGLYSPGDPPLPCKNHVLGTCCYCVSPRIFLRKCWGPKLRPSCLHTKCFSNTILLSKMLIVIFWKHFSAACALFKGWVLCLSHLPVMVVLLFGSHF